MAPLLLPAPLTSDPPGRVPVRSTGFPDASIHPKLQTHLLLKAGRLLQRLPFRKVRFFCLRLTAVSLSPLILLLLCSLNVP